MKKGVTVLLALMLSIISTYAVTCNSCATCETEVGNAGADISLSSNIVASGGCVGYQGADNIKFNCAGYKITNSNPGVGTAIDFAGGTNMTVLNCRTENFDTGIDIGGAGDYNYINNTFILNSTIGISAQTQNFLTIENTKVYNSSGRSIYGGTLKNFTLRNSILDGSSGGVYAMLYFIGGDNRIINNTFSNSNGTAISIAASPKTLIFGNRIYNVTYNGGSRGHGIVVASGSHYANISNNNISRVDLNCVYVDSSDFIAIRNNTLNNCGRGSSSSEDGGININQGVDDSKIEFNTISDADFGITGFEGTERTIISNNTITDINGQTSSAAIYLWGNGIIDMILNENVISDASAGVLIPTASASGNQIKGNSFTDTPITINSTIAYSTTLFGSGTTAVFPSITGALINPSLFTTVGGGIVSINATAIPSLNKSANITMQLPSGQACPATIYYYSQYATTVSDIINNGQVCNAGTTPACTAIQCSGSIVTFNVPHFDGFGGQGAEVIVPEFNLSTILLIMISTVFAVSLFRKTK